MAAGSAAAGMPSGAAIEKDGFTLRLQVDVDALVTNEPLYEVGPVKLNLRFAGDRTDGYLAWYDSDCGNYVNFRRSDGTCPVLEATIAEKAGRVGVPLAALAMTGSVVAVTLDLSPVRWSIDVNGCVDEDWPVKSCPVLWPTNAEERILSPRVREVRLFSPSLSRHPVAGEVLPRSLSPMPDVRPLSGSMQYWTPEGVNAWVGDVAPAWLQGRLHLFYLFDRRHHLSGDKTGRHQFAHLSTTDLVHWCEHPLAVAITEPWQTVGTGTPFLKDGQLALAYGWHTYRYAEYTNSAPMGGTYALSDDGVRFRPLGRMITDAQNPSIYNRPDGSYELVTSFGGEIGIYRSDDLEDWRLFDAQLPFRGDCPTLFDWHSHRYLLQGFTNMAYSATGEAGSFVDLTQEPDALYEGLSVPMVTAWRDDRRLYIGWLNHLHGWGGWLVFRELVYEPDGHLGLKWVPEIAPPVPPQAFAVKGGEHFKLRFEREDGAPALVLAVDPTRRTASWCDDSPQAVFSLRRADAKNLEIGGVRGLDGDYQVRVIAYYDRKSDATIFDAEVAARRTLIVRRSGRYRQGVND